MPTEETFHCIVFADVCQSTLLFNKLGDSEAFNIISKIQILLKKQSVHFSGKLIKTIGDGMMFSFEDSENAFKAACEMQKSVENNSFVNKFQVSIKIGIHAGFVICDADDVFGNAVNVAARVLDIAQAKQIITTQATINTLPKDSPFNIRYLRKMSVKGIEEGISFFEIVWQEDISELTVTGIKKDYLKENCTSPVLALTYHDAVYTIDEKCTSIKLGRGNQNDLVFDSQFSSRSHAIIEYRNEKFVLTDHSYNGTYLLINERYQFVHRDTVYLSGKGKISLGCEISNDDNENIKYSVKI